MENKFKNWKQRILKLSVFLLGNLILLSSTLFAEGSTLKLTTEETVKRALESNYNLQNLRYELAKSDTNFLKNDSKYSWRLIADGKSSQSILPFNQANFFTGTKISDDTIKGGIEKILQTTGTYFKVEAGSRRFDSNAFENPSTTPAGFSSLGIPPLYTGFVRATISQDLLKNSFGYKGRNEVKILESQAEIVKNQVSQQISSVIVDSLVDFWDYSIKTQAVKTYKQLVENTRNIRNLTARKQNLGLSESFEVNQWNALLAQAQNQLETAQVQKEESKRKLIRSLKIPDNTTLSEETNLLEELVEKPEYTKDLEYAYKHRADFLNALKQKEIAEAALKNANNDRLPTLTLSGTGASQAQNIIAPQDNYNDTNQGITTAKYKEWTGQVNFVYPIADKGIYAGVRDANIGMRQATLKEEELKNEVRDDVKTRIEALEASHRIYKNNIVTERETASYYNGVFRSFRQGRADAVAVKNALDTHVQDQLRLTQAKVNFNIDLLRYYLAKNALMERFQVDRDKLIPHLD
ncbi:TolC family protein [Leptospira noguchii]|uniref:TolC family protein n=1 Tax=Leptospira noguchii TaxID=28182 RepID=A0AAE9G8N6_9LEPT|nr:TolC family protein [Leptospira noguchii]UOG29638.1 TolC family protein [Leptospira noguchii]UOG35036.1 TolC family protein [Leptospira noguchii]UOG45942.1 TolC family protein [Leptospira noguchii]UOG55774.1 TolC family protein [Leptospira noguchii]